MRNHYNKSPAGQAPVDRRNVAGAELGVFASEINAVTAVVYITPTFSENRENRGSVQATSGAGCAHLCALKPQCLLLTSTEHRYIY